MGGRWQGCNQSQLLIQLLMIMQMRMIRIIYSGRREVKQNYQLATRRRQIRSAICRSGDPQIGDL
jgi:hypothetical protein